MALERSIHSLVRSSAHSTRSRESYGTFRSNGEDPRSGNSKIVIHAKSAQASWWKRHLFNLIWFIYDQWFLVGLGLFILLPSHVQVPKAQQKKKEEVVTYICIAVISSQSGCTLPTKILWQNYSRWRLHLFCQTQSFLMTSAIVFAVVWLCATNANFMDAGLLVGLIIAGCVPKQSHPTSS